MSFYYQKYKVKPTKSLTKRKKTDMIILHCSATPENKDYSLDLIDAWHKQRNFSCIGYNWVIKLNGDIWEARGDEMSGAHTTNYNSRSVGICYIGGCASDGKTAKNTLNDEQKLSLFILVQHLLEKYKLTIDDVYCHGQFVAKSCPSFKIEWFKNEFRKWEREQQAK